jgi:hypothetical protein
VRALVVYEPPAYGLCTDADAHRSTFQRVLDTFHRKGAAEAMSELAEYVGVSPSDQESEFDGAPDDPDLWPPELVAKLRQLIRVAEFYLEFELRQFNGWMPDLRALGGLGGRIRIGVGRDSQHLRSAAPGLELARRLNSGVTIFPGGHSVFASFVTGAAQRLREVLQVISTPATATGFAPATAAGFPPARGAAVQSARHPERAANYDLAPPLDAHQIGGRLRRWFRRS